MKTREKTDQEKAQDRKEVRDTTTQLQKDALSLILEFEQEFHDVDFDIQRVPVGIVSRMLQIRTGDLDRAKFRVTQSHVGDAFTENTTWKGYYPWLKLS
jgi:hypothetical protein